MNPRYVIFAALTVLIVSFLVPTGPSGMAASAAITPSDAVAIASSPIADSDGSRSAQSDKSERNTAPAKRNDVASRASAPTRTSASSGRISDANRKPLPTDVRPKVAGESATDVLPDAALISSGDVSRAGLPPRNDDCLNAERIGLPTPGFATGTTVDATADAAPVCSGNGSNAPGVWYSVIGTGNKLTATTCSELNTHPDTVILVYCAGCDTLNCTASNDNSCAGVGNDFLSTVSWCSEVGVEYLILVQNFGTGSGDFSLSIFDGDRCKTPPNCVRDGACCDDGECLGIMSEEQCLELGGVYQGQGSTCDVCTPIQCGQSKFPVCDGECSSGLDCMASVSRGGCFCDEPSFEACCLPDDCVDALPDACRANRGIPRGRGTDCKTVNICRDDPCEHCGEFPHWIDQCGGPGLDAMPSGAVVGLDLGPEFDCVADVSLVLHGPAHVRRSVPRDDSVNFPATRPVDGHLDVIDTEMLQMILTGGGVIMTAGAGQDTAGLLPPTYGVIAEQLADPVFADSFFHVFFAIEVAPGLVAYNHTPLVVDAKIDCIPPDDTYIHVTGCISLFDSPPGTTGQIIAQLVSANHSTYPDCGDPGTGDCHVPHDAPFCNDGECCATVCNVLPRCCTNAWEDECTDAAQELCDQACCALDGTCRDATTVDCTTSGGVSQGPGSTCAPGVCDPVQCGQSPFPDCGGVCPNGTVCTASAPNGPCACEPISCGQSDFPGCNGECPADMQCVTALTAAFCFCQTITEACCFENGSCQNLPADQCRGSDGAPRGPGTACQDDGDGNGRDDVCEFDQPCDDCGGGGQAHWIDNCPAGTDYMPTGAIVGIDTDFDCLVDINLVLTGAAQIGREAGTPHSIDTEILSMTLTGGGAVLRAGAGGGVGPGAPLPASLGLIVEQDAAGVLADSSFKVLFEIDLGGGLFVYNQTPMTIYGKIDCVPPDRIYTHFVGCLPLYDSPVGGDHVANLTSANHDTYPPENCPLPFPDSICAELQKDDCVGTPDELCLPRIVRVTENGFEPIECSCFGADEGCGRIQVDPGADLLSCTGLCPNPNDTCRIFVDGNQTNLTSAPSTAFPPGSVITCDCPKPPPDPHLTVQGTSVTFGADDVPAIPAGFFFPGSLPFVGAVNLVGGPTDTLGQRDGPIVCSGAGFPIACDPVGLELVRLDLVSVIPIVVGGTQWEIAVALSPTGSPPLGTLDAVQTHPNGGTYDASIPFVPAFHFTQVGRTAAHRTLDYDTLGREIIIHFVAADWVIHLGPGLDGTIDAPNNGNFVPGVRENNPGDPNSQKVRQSLGESKGGGIDHPVRPRPRDTEACCFDDGNCQNLPVSQCRGADGAPRGPGTACQGDGDGNGVDDACEFDTKCEHCGPGDHWIDTCPAGHDRLPSGVVLGIDTNGDCLVDRNLVMFGPAEVARGAGVPHQILPTEMVAMTLTGGGAVLRAGAGGGVGPSAPLGPSLGVILENGGNPAVGESSFGILFELDLGAGLFAYNQVPLSLTADILCVSPNRIYEHPRGCFPLFDSPIPGLGNFVANLVTANHDPFGEPLCPLSTFDPLQPCLDRQILDCVGSDLQLCLPRVFTNTDGTAEALRCDCFDDDDTCGLVFIGGDGDFFGCDGSCPGAKQLCEIHIDGSSTGADRIPIVDVADGAEVTCDCTCTKSAPPGTDCWTTACDGSTQYDFSLTPIPAGFFAPGSAPFTDVVALGGATGGLDTQIQRLDEMCFDGPLPVTQTTAIQIVHLELVSCENITVDVNGQTEEWRVIVQLTGAQTQGTLTAVKRHEDGGTYTTDIPVNAEFLFERVSDGQTAGPLPTGDIVLSTTVPAPWQQTGCNGPCGGTGFCPGLTTDPGGDPCCKPTCHGGPGPGHKHCTVPPDCPACPECTWNNGPPLDDFGGPASQYDALSPEVFSAEAADDFFFTGEGTNPCGIQRARFWATYFNTPDGVVPNPVTQWRGVTVNIYDNADPKGPAGNRNDDGTFTTGLVATRTVPMSNVNVIPSTFACLGAVFQIDVTFADPISLEKNHKYWIVVQPNMDLGDDQAGGPGYGQVAVLLSQETHDHPAQQIFPLAGLPNWSELSGNGGTNGLCNNLPPGSRKDIAFELFAVKPSRPFGACCAPQTCIGGGNCDTGTFSNRCGGTFNCACFDTADGGVSCTQGHDCETLTPCPNGTSDCIAGETCNINTCCGEPRCEPVDCGAPPRDSSETVGLMSTGAAKSRGLGGAFCRETTRDDCAFLGGRYLGDATICEPDSCQPPPDEACCLPNGECVNAPLDECLAHRGVPRGPDTACEGDADGNGIDDACEDEPCADCGPGEHWVDLCTPGIDSMPSGAKIGLDLGPEFDCVPDVTLVLHGPVHIRRSSPRDDSVNFPNTRPIDTHLDVIDTEMLQLILTGGGVVMTAGAAQDAAGMLPATYGYIAEQGLAPEWADSSFEVFFAVELAPGVVAYNHTPLVVNSKIDCIPPDATYIHPTGCIPLFDTPPGIQGGIVAQLVRANHSTYPSCGDPVTGSCFDPNGTPFCDKRDCCERVCGQLPRCCTDGWDKGCVQAAFDICDGHFIERDEFEFSVGRLELVLPDGTVETIAVTGPATALVFFEGPNAGDAFDNDGNNLDEVQTEMVSLSLSGVSPSLGPITVDLNPAFPSLGLIEEKEDTLTGRLDLPPFAPTGGARSYFDMFFRVHAAGLTFHTITPKRMSSQISHKPPGPGAVYESPQRIRLYDENGRPTGYFLGATRHQPNPLVSTFPPHCAIDARQPHPVNRNDNGECGVPKFGWDKLILQFNVDPTLLNLQPSDFSVFMDPTGTPPFITNVVPDAASQTVLIRLNQPIEPRHWTCVVYTATGRRWCLGYLPSDTNQDRLSATSDIGALINSINLVPGRILPEYATDIDRSGMTLGSDILREIDLLNGAGCFDMWITRELPDCPWSYPEPPD